MKRFRFPFSWKSAKIQRGFLFAGLFVALGFNLSWNPENTQIARYEYGHPGFSELASEYKYVDNVMEEGSSSDKIQAAAQEKPAADKDKPAQNGPGPLPTVTQQKPGPTLNGRSEGDQKIQYYEVELKEFDSSMEGITVKAAVNGDGNRVSYNLEGKNVEGNCVSCVGIQEIPISRQDVKQLEFFKRAIAKDAIKKLQDAGTRREEKEGKHHGKYDKKEKKTGYESECTMELKEGLIECQKDEMLGLAKKCEEIKKATDKRTCLNAVTRYFTKELQKNIRKGLASQADSDVFTEASSARDELIAELPESFDENIKKALVAMTANGIFNRAETVYNMCKMQGQICSDGYAAMMAKQQMRQEMNTIGFPLRQTLLDYGMDAGNSMTMQRMYMESFQNPLDQFYQQNSQNGINWQAYGGSLPGLNNIPGLDQVPGLAPGSSQGAYQARTDSNRQNYPGPQSAFGNARPGGGPVPGQLPNQQGQYQNPLMQQQCPQGGVCQQGPQGGQYQSPQTPTAPYQPAPTVPSAGLRGGRG